MTVPHSTYRLQISRDFTLGQAAEVCDYLAELGVGAVYLSPVLTATPGSAHGYDAVDPTTIDPERGGEEGWTALVAAARAAGLGVVVDIVPNHLGVADASVNPSWWSVLREGPGSPYAAWYDIEWSNPPILLPVLGSPDDVAGLTLSDDRTELRYYDHRFPVAPGTADDAADAAAVHDRQHYRLVDWHRGDAELTYRRFFAVTTLAGARQEDEAVFDATHARIRAMVEADEVTGLRVDHPDGLVDPGQYFTRLRELAGDRWLIGEKILEPGEPLPDWPIEGTSGYDAMTEVNSVFVDPAGEDAFTADYRDRTGDQLDVEAHVEAGKLMVARTLFGAERARMARLVPDLDAGPVADALAELAARFDVYRSYLPEGVEHLDAALARARAARPDLTGVLDALSPRLHDPAEEIARRLQQLSGAVMAKGVEDTAFYRYARLVGLNEVGGAPGRFGWGLDAFHDAMARRQADQPAAMTALSTHDTKRSEDVRARLAALAELPGEWGRFADVFFARTRVADRPLAYFLAQTMAGAGLLERERLHAYAEKAMREAAVATTWTAPDEAFERSVHEAVDQAYDDAELHEAWVALDAALTAPGRSNAVAAKLVQLTMPGVPDVYQGTEFYDDSLVDPDNRRPVDYARRRARLAAGPAAFVPEGPDEGAFKQWVVQSALTARREHDLDRYSPVRARGEAADHLLGFDRGGLTTLAVRRPVGLAARGGWGETTVDLAGPHVDRLTGRTHETGRLADLLGDRPVALLTPLPR